MLIMPKTPEKIKVQLFKGANAFRWSGVPPPQSYVPVGPQANMVSEALTFRTMFL